LTPVLGWRDIRSATPPSGCDRCRSGAVQARTGRAPPPFYWPAKLVWPRSRSPTSSPAAALRLVRGYLYEQLLGAPSAESVSLASGTGLLDLAARAGRQLVEITGVGEEQLSGSRERQRGLVSRVDRRRLLETSAPAAPATRARALMVGTSEALRILYETERRRRGRPLPLPARRAARRRGGALSDGGNLAAGSGAPWRIRRARSPGAIRATRAHVPPLSRR